MTTSHVNHCARTQGSYLKHSAASLTEGKELLLMGPSFQVI